MPLLARNLGCYAGVAAAPGHPTSRPFRAYVGMLLHTHVGGCCSRRTTSPLSYVVRYAD